MSIEKLQEKIRKRKNPSVIDFSITRKQIPSFLFEQEETAVRAYERYCRDILCALKDIVPAVRFSYGYFALMGADGFTLLQKLMEAAKSYGYYVLLDTVEFSSLDATAFAVERLQELPADGFVCYQYSGEDAVKPYVDMAKDAGKSVFVNIRTPNKSASQLQDLMTGSRLVYMAAADIVKRLGNDAIGKSGYSQVAGVVAANSIASLRSVRGMHKHMFLLIDGYDYTNANAKNCSYAFDELGHGAAVCAGSSVTAAWCDEQVDCRNYTESAVRAAERMRKNITNYITIL